MTTKKYFRTVDICVRILLYKLESRRFDSRWCHRNLHWHNLSDCAMVLGSTQPLTVF